MATTRLTAVERQVLRCHGMPARDTAIAVGISVERVMALRRQLRERRAFPVSPAVIEAATGQLTLEAVDHVMRTNRAPAGL